MESSEPKVLNAVRHKVNVIQEQLMRLYPMVPDLYSSSCLMNKLHETYAAFQHTSLLLKNPSLRIAAIGTTSSGKSTLINGLVGRQIAPMNAGEMSAGVLHLVHAARNRLYIKRCGGLWPEINRFDLSDIEIYDQIRNDIFKTYHSIIKFFCNVLKLRYPPNSIGSNRY